MMTNGDAPVPAYNTLGGLFRTQPGSEDPLSQERFYAACILRSRATPLAFRPLRLAGLLDYLRPHEWVTSAAPPAKKFTSWKIAALAQGHVACHFLGRTREEWGERARRGPGVLRLGAPKRVPRCIAEQGHGDFEGCGGKSSGHTIKC